MEAELFHAEGGPSDMTKLTVALRNFAMRLKIPAVHLKRTKSADYMDLYSAA